MLRESLISAGKLGVLWCSFTCQGPCGFPGADIRLYRCAVDEQVLTDFGCLAGQGEIAHDAADWHLRL